MTRAFGLGRETILRDGEPVGWLSSAGYGHSVNKWIGYGYVRSAQGVDSLLQSGVYELEIATERVPASHGRAGRSQGLARSALSSLGPADRLPPFIDGAGAARFHPRDGPGEVGLMRRAFMVCSLLVVASCSEQVVVREVESTCGNGEVEAGEACDDGNTRNGDACTSGCAVAQCGDEITRQDLEPGEEGAVKPAMMGTATTPTAASATAPWRVARRGGALGSLRGRGGL